MNKEELKVFLYEVKSYLDTSLDAHNKEHTIAHKTKFEFGMQYHEERIRILSFLKSLVVNYDEINRKVERLSKKEENND